MGKRLKLKSLIATFFITILFTLPCSLLLAESITSATQPQSPNVQQLGFHRQWLHLLHVRPHGLTRQLKSENDSERFFLSATGKTDPISEMQAAIEAFSQTGMADNQSLQCRFPARYHWLKQFFPNWQNQPCSELKTWQKTLDAHAISLIFPASYLNSPSSMYGHTLVRLDRADKNKSQLLAYSVNFAANADHNDNELVFSYKGLTGGYPGVVSVQPYYAKVNEYSHLEYRDVWEYQLNLNQNEVDQFVRHIWETKETEFDYFFFDENCSYRLLALLDAASERINLTHQFDLVAVPVDTIRALQRDELVSNVDYRPSAASQLAHQQSYLDPQQQQLARDIADDQQHLDSAEFRHLPPTQQAQVLEVSISYLRYLAVKKKQSSTELRQRSIALLSARSKIPIKEQAFPSIPTPSVRDDQGHLTHRLSVWAGEQNNRGLIDIGLRLAYHEHLDLANGYTPGAQIQMGDFRLRSHQHQQRIEHFTVIDVFSLSPRDHFQQPISWRVTTGWERLITDRDNSYAHLNIAGGYTYTAAQGLLYGLVGSRFNSANHFDKNYQALVGLQSGWLYQGPHWQLQFEVGWFDAALGDNSNLREANLRVGRLLTDRLQVRVELQHQTEFGGIHDDSGESMSLGINHYF